MDESEFYRFLAGIKREEVAEGRGIIINLMFKSANKFLVLSRQIQSVLDNAIEWADMMQGDVDGFKVAGPRGKKGGKKKNRYKVFTLHQPDWKYYEAARLGVHRKGNDGWGSFQYTAPGKQRAIEVGLDILSRTALVEHAEIASHKNVPVLESTRRKEVTRHFNRFRPFWYYLDHPVSTVSDHVTDWFYKRGWFLYENPGSSQDLEKLAEKGPAELIHVNTMYTMHPVCLNAMSETAMKRASKKMKESGLEPKMTRMARRKMIAAVQFYRDHVEFFFLDSSRSERVGYDELERTIKSEVSMYSTKYDAAGKWNE